MGSHRVPAGFSGPLPSLTPSSSGTKPGPWREPLCKTNKSFFIVGFKHQVVGPAVQHDQLICGYRARFRVVGVLDHRHTTPGSLMLLDHGGIEERVGVLGALFERCQLNKREK